MQTYIPAEDSSSLYSAEVFFVLAEDRRGKNWSRIRKGIFSRSAQLAAARLHTSAPLRRTSLHLAAGTSGLSLEEPWWWSSPCLVRWGCCTLLLCPSAPGTGAWLTLYLPGEFIEKIICSRNISKHQARIQRCFFDLMLCKKTNQLRGILHSIKSVNRTGIVLVTMHYDAYEFCSHGGKSKKYL